MSEVQAINANAKPTLACGYTPFTEELQLCSARPTLVVRMETLVVGIPSFDNWSIAPLSSIKDSSDPPEETNARRLQ